MSDTIIVGLLSLPHLNKQRRAFVVTYNKQNLIHGDVIEIEGEADADG